MTKRKNHKKSTVHENYFAGIAERDDGRLYAVRGYIDEFGDQHIEHSILLEGSQLLTREAKDRFINEMANEFLPTTKH